MHGNPPGNFDVDILLQFAKTNFLLNVIRPFFLTKFPKLPQNPPNLPFVGIASGKQ
jgi:hypothetical protein